jgi:hypothetical protein
MPTIATDSGTAKPKVRRKPVAPKAETVEEPKKSSTPGGYYLGKDDPKQIFFREGVRRSKKDPLVATAVDEDSAIVLVEQANLFFRCQCGEADSLVQEMIGDPNADDISGE